MPAWGESLPPHIRLAQPGLAQASASLEAVPIENGILRRKKGRDAIAPLKIETPTSSDYVLKLVNVRNDAEEMLIYVRRGSLHAVKVPLGTYRIHGAFGATWYGQSHLFGPDTSYFKLVQKGSKSDTFAFYRGGNQVRGYFVKLIEQLDGNLETPKIAAADF
jgi:hypothetical protein